MSLSSLLSRGQALPQPGTSRLPRQPVPRASAAVQGLGLAGSPSLRGAEPAPEQHVEERDRRPSCDFRDASATERNPAVN